MGTGKSKSSALLRAKARAPPSVALRQLVLATSLWLALRAASAANIGNPADVSPLRRGSETRNASRFSVPRAAGEGARRAEGGALDLARDLRVPVCRGEGRSEMSARIARTMRASSLSVHGSTVNEPRHALADPERAARRARRSGGVSLLTFFAQAKKVSRSPAGRVEALALQPITKIESKSWIPAYAGMTSKRMDSRLRGDDEPKIRRDTGKPHAPRSRGVRDSSPRRDA